jgi:predicted nucleic acid-binding protein
MAPLATIDTNVLIRFHTQDNVELAEKAQHIIDELEQGERTVLLTDVVVREVVYILTSPRLYSRPRAAVCEYLRSVIALRGVRVSEKAVLLRALSVYEGTSFDIVDAMLLALAEVKGYPIITFDERLEVHSKLTSSSA